MVDRKRFRTVAITFDVRGQTEGEYAEFATNLIRFQREFAGSSMHGWHFTDGWPRVDVVDPNAPDPSTP